MSAGNAQTNVAVTESGSSDSDVRELLNDLDARYDAVISEAGREDLA